ncbi:MAG: TIGR02391 family protein [Candidatus Yonathbacteria bacterium RIFCSPLOWO2_01_FULL_43_20]|nr:MAG: TIGR02391 family protein [Candidatus Yonathbacteria bacterium RIFCSPLOWO2_01_FULL_43_20]
MKSEIEAKIEYQEVIGEANPGGYQPIRFTRVKYKASPETHIDIRQFQRGYDDKGEEEFYPTKKGFRFLEHEFNRVIKEYVLMPETYVHPIIVRKSFPLLKNGQFESAVLQAFKTIETRIRKRIGADPDDVGVKLIRKAFNPENGPLTDYALPKAEREAFCNYIAGAFGYYKNPCSHRDVEMNFLSAFDRIVVASDLLKVIEKSNINE